MTNLIENLVQWQDIAYLIGTSGASREESLLSATAAFAINAALDDATKLLPFVVANGLLVRYLHASDNISIICANSFFIFADMAVLQNMERLFSHYRALVNSFRSRDW